MTGFPSQVDVIRARADRATPGPWAWFGDTSSQRVYLATRSWGRHIVMQFGRWGMQGAQPEFFGGRTVTRDTSGRVEIHGSEHQPASKIPVYEVAPNAKDSTDPAVYRQDIVALRNADAVFLAHSREDIDHLLKEVDRLQGIVTNGIESRADGISALRQVGWRCEHPYGTPEANTHQSWNHRKGKLRPEANVTSATYPLRGWDDAQRCPSAVPTYVEAVAS